MSFDAHDEESLFFKLRLKNPDGVRQNLLDRSGRSADDARRVCEVHGIASCEECFPRVEPSWQSPAAVRSRERDEAMLNARSESSPAIEIVNDLFDDDLNIRVAKTDDVPPIEEVKRGRAGVLEIGVNDCDWTLHDAVKRGDESLRKFCRLLARDLAPFLHDTQFKRPLYFQEARRHRTTEENAAAEPAMIPVFAVTEVESRFYRDYAGNNRTRDQLIATYGRWPKEKDFIDLEGRILRHAFKVGLISLPKARRVQSDSTLEMTWSEEQVVDLFVKGGFTLTKDQSNTAAYHDDITQKNALAEWIKEHEEG